jgi:hypothetical protein
LTIICRQIEKKIAELELKLKIIQFKGIIPSSQVFMQEINDLATILGYGQDEITALFGYYRSISQEELSVVFLEEKKTLNALLLQQGKFHLHINIDSYLIEREFFLISFVPM